MRKHFSLLSVLMVLSVFTWAQVKTITGKVTDEKNEPVPFASIRLKSTKTGTSADADGNYTIRAQQGDVLVVSATGIVQQEITVGTRDVQNISVKKTGTQLSEVVVSALGIKRSVKSTPYATQQISAERLTQTRETDLTSALAGKIAGLQVLGQSGSKLGSTGIVRLRGVASFGDRGAIYVVDGTIVQNVTDINMDDVANVQVLKGPNATALYGQRAEGGVIMITTKKTGKNKPLGIEFNSTITIDKVNILPQYQNIYGGGGSSNPNDAWAEDAYVWHAGDPNEWKALQGYRRQQYFDDASWGPKMDGGDYIPWYAWYGGHSGSFKPAKFTAQPDNIRKFFETGVTANNNISVSKSGDWWNLRLSYTNLSKTGIIPNSKQDKNFFSTQNSFELGKHLTLASNVGVTMENFRGDFFDEYGNNTIGSFSQWFHRNLDMDVMKQLRGLKSPAGTFASWNIDDGAGMSSASIQQPAFWFNPYTWLDNLDNRTKRNRVMGDISLAYKLNSNFKITGTYRLNYRTTNTKVKIPQVLENSGGTYGNTTDESGNLLYSKYRNDDTKYRENNFELIAQFNKKVNNITIELIGGGNVLDIKRDDSTRTTNGGLTKPDVFEIANSKGAPGLGGGKSFRQVRSLFFRGTLGFSDILFLDFSGRNDWSSTLPVNNNSYFYPSIGGSFVFSEYLKNTPLSFGKLRASVAQVGSDPLNPYALNFVFATGTIPYNNDSLSGVPNTFIDKNLKSPLNTSLEVGLDLRFLRDRIGFFVTYYSEQRKNEIVSTNVSNATGFLAGIINAGEIRRKGVELELNVKPIITRNFTWDFTANWATNTSTVEKVSDATDLFTIYANYVGQPIVAGIAGKQWGQLRATGIKRINGMPVIDPSTGLYEFEDDKDFGSVLPQYTGGFFNSFTYKGFVLSAAIDYQFGGKYFSFSDFNGKYTGLLKETADLNDNGVNVREPIADGGGVHAFGVTADGKPYDTYVNAFNYFRQFNDNSIWDYSIFDATYIKLRELSLGYEIPVQKLGPGIAKTIKRAYVSAVARNLWMIYSKNRNMDPSEVAVLYAENGQLPGTRAFGLNLKLVF